MEPSPDASTPSTQLQSGSHAAAPLLPSPLLASQSDESSPAFGSVPEAAQYAAVPPTQFAVSVSARGVAMEPTKKGKGVGRRLTDRQRVEILELIEKSGGTLSNAEIGRRYGITRAAIQKLKQKGAEVRARYRYGSAETRDARKRGGHVMSVPFERELFEWVRGLKARKVPVPPSLVKEKAKLLVPKYGLGNFQASNGWYYNFCKRFNLSTGVLVEEKAPAVDVDTSLDTDQAELQQMTLGAQAYEQIQQFHHQQIAAITAATLQQPGQLQEQQQPAEEESGTQALQIKSDRMLALLEQQNALLERQNSMIEEQAETIKKLFAVMTKGKLGS
ncbi:Tc5 transposase DNA-binding domain [Phytophthora infestans]|uniref:Tc5 transposase DNA-binding domain n=1 Tax=Phytophthora infestans TaxID=4787 RepID=A0A833WNH4_PHYIN|nr:Tc5 transposase DNA-binding domain [Phytophthora infestans]